MKHYHDEDMQSLSLRSDKPLDPAKFMPWLQQLVQTEGGKILRVTTLAAEGPGSLKAALDNSRKDQTVNTPALATLFLTVHQIDWFNSNGGLAFAAIDELGVGKHAL